MYAFIPLANAQALANPETYVVRIPQCIPGLAPDLLDTNGNGIPNVLELEAVDFSADQKADIANLYGQWFATAEAYNEYKASLLNA